MTEQTRLAGAQVSTEIIQALDQLAKRRGVERTKIIRWAFIDYLEKNGVVISTNEPDEPHEEKAA